MIISWRDELTWWIIGGSMIAANISTHHFIGMSGLAYKVGLAVAGFEWIAAITLILYGRFFLPYYLKSPHYDDAQIPRSTASATRCDWSTRSSA